MSTANVGGWRRQAASVEDKKEKSRTRSGPRAGSRFGNKFRPGNVPRTIRLIPGQYKVPSAVNMGDGKFGVTADTLVYYNCGTHYDRSTERSTICSGGPLFANKQHAQPCIPCKIWFTAPKGNDGKRQCSVGFRSEVYVFNVLDFSPYVRVEQVDKFGLVKLNDKTGKPYTEWIVKGSRDAKVLEEKLGHMLHWPLFSQDFNTLMLTDSIVGQSCRSCGGNCTITRCALMCAKCNEAIIECDQTNVPTEEQDKLLVRQVTCPHCKHVGPLLEYLDCSNCRNPVRATIFDVNVTVVSGPSGLVLNCSAPCAIDAAYKPQPLNLVELYSPDSLEMQERMFGTSWEDLIAADQTAF